MPELPEVETTKEELKKLVLKRKIVDVWSDTPKIVKNIDFSDFKREIKGRIIKDIQRKGKNIIFLLDKDRAFLIHQKLTGHLLYGKWKKNNDTWIPEKEGPLSDPMNRFLHLIFFLDNKKMLALSDLRKFAKVIFGKKEEIFSLPEIISLGPDALEIDFEKFKENLQRKPNLQIKKVLMDQNIISGIGNIYSDEILFASKINPFKKIKDLKENDFKLLFKNTKDILKKAIKLKGESISDYRIPDGTKGNFDKIRKVYRREGQNCFICGTKIIRKKIQGRSTYFCPSCQPL
jgi:formamidopyrimidine-DNA glycosylase